ncbi:MAG: asparagine synthase (glutamine-hydrolyzing), partial [Lentisphaerae bacterium]|nr:asparagine synthase (glutamine-hydrolyzing) [Lentisphaerota bacterium]
MNESENEGAFVHENLGLGVCRIDVKSESGNPKPIFSEDKELVIVFSSHLHNSASLRSDLLNRGHAFETLSDEEVVLNAYQEFGTMCFERLTGAYAFAIGDLKSRKFVVVRDKAGEKPLYYHKSDRRFLFSSSLKSVIGSGLVQRTINKEALNHYFQLTYIPAPLTIYQHVSKLLPGHYIEIPISGSMAVQKYWDVNYDTDSLIVDYEDCKKELRQTLFNAVEECMTTQLSIGAFLSGGIDSAIITGIAAQISKKPVDAFTIGYRDKRYDESDRAKLTAQLHNVNHHVVCLDYDEVLPELDRVLNSMDEPFADSSLIPTYMVSKFASDYVSSVLTGDSGDELFGGYSKYLIGYYAERYNKIPPWIRENVIQKGADLLPDRGSLMRKVRKVVGNSQKSVFEQHKSLMCLGFQRNEIAMLLQPHWLGLDDLSMISDCYYSLPDNAEQLARALYTDFKVVLEGDMLEKVRRAGMLSSLETRIPMLHSDVVTLAARIPSRYKICRRNTKVVLKEAFEDLIPKRLLTAGKRGFSVPMGDWFRNELKRDLLEMLSKDRIVEQGILNYSHIELALNEHFSSTHNRSGELWA